MHKIFFSIEEIYWIGGEGATTRNTISIILTENDPLLLYDSLFDATYAFQITVLQHDQIEVQNSVQLPIPELLTEVDVK